MPGECAEYYFDGKLSKCIDSAAMSDKQLAAMRTLANKINSSKSSYTSFGRGVGRWVVNSENKIVEMHLNWRLTSLRQIALAQLQYNS